jgi:hypothetical protein
VVGTYSDSIGKHGFVYLAGEYTTLDVPGAVPGSTSAVAINDNGQIVGSYSPGDTAACSCDSLVFLYRSGSFTNIPPVSVLNAAVAINKRGEVIGNATTDPAVYGTGFLYRQGTVMVINVPGQTAEFLDSVSGISGAGVIAGSFLTADGGHGFVDKLRQGNLWVI